MVGFLRYLLGAGLDQGDAARWQMLSLYMFDDVALPSLMAALTIMATRRCAGEGRWDARALAMHLAAGVIYVGLFELASLGWYLLVAASPAERQSADFALYGQFVAVSLTTDLVNYVIAVAWWFVFVAGRDQRRAQARSDRWTARLAASELRQLRNQLQPHFLANSLNAVLAFVRTDAAIADEMLARLGRYLDQLGRANSTDLATLGEELSLAREYLAIHHRRFGARLVSSVESDERCDAVRVPSLLLQPLVENAVVHGVESHVGPAFVRLRCRLHEGRLHIEIENSVGGHAESDESALPEPSRGVGLSNARERIRWFYGPRSSLQLERRMRSVLVTINIPARFSPPSSNASLPG